MVVSIHQPNYLPWIGFIDKLSKSDVFVVFDDVQFPVGKNHFGHRTKIRSNTGDMWMTLQVNGKSSKRTWEDTTITTTECIPQHLQNINHFYHKSEFFGEVYHNIVQVFNVYKMQDTCSIVDLNVDLIIHICRLLDIDTTIVKSSQLDGLNKELSGEEHIMDILKYVGATRYISGTGPGSRRYIEEENFKKAGIQLTWQDFKHPIYQQQFEPFYENLSIIDMMFNIGIDESKKIFHVE